MPSSLVERLADEVRRIAFQHSAARRDCAHLDAITVADPAPGRPVCPSCAERGSQWLKLRMCLTCGAVGCCDSSDGHHARAHFESTGHPVMRSVEPGEVWAWCYPDQTYLRTSPV